MDAAKMNPESNISTLEENEFIKEYSNVRNHTDAEWQMVITDAILRLFRWNDFITKEETVLDNSNQRNDTDLKTISFGKFLPAAKMLLNSAKLTNDHSYGSQQDVLMRLNDLLSTNSSLLKDENASAFEGIIKDFYSNFSLNPYIIIAAIALFDVHGERQGDAPPETNKRSHPLELYPNIFRPMINGLNVGWLLRKWDQNFYKFLNGSEFERKEREYKSKQEIANKYAIPLISSFNAFFKDSGLTVENDELPISKLCCLESEDSNYDLASATFLKITSDDEWKCYKAEAWVESLGTVQKRFLRKSFLQEKENGAREFEVGIKLKNENRLLIVRIGTQGSFRLEEWGRLLHFETYAEEICRKHEKLLAEMSKGGKIYVYKTNGELIGVSKGCTVAEFIDREYRQKEYKALNSFINGFPVSFDRELRNQDLVDVVFQDDCQDRLLRKGYSLQNKSFMQPINAQCQEETEDELKILEGKNRLILKIQKYLIPWNFRIDEHQISILLVNMNHLFGNSSLEEIYTELAYDQTNDEEICQWALQYKTRGRIQLSNGNSLPAIYNWKNTKIAQCCKPNFEDEIIGSIWKSPKDPKHPAYQRFHELKIHKMNCPAGPKENKLAVTWSSSDSHKNGFVVEALINDAVGCLGEFLNIFYNTNLSIHSVRADAINFQNKASIGVHATAFTRDELETTKELIIKRYGIQSITTRYLRNLEVAQLTCQKKSNPYIISSEPELEKNLPVLFFGREDELRKLAFVLHDHRSRRVLVNGYYRIGKTWFLKQFKLVYHMPSRHIVNILVNNIQLSNNPIRDFVHEIYLQTIESLEDEKMVSSEILQRPQNFSELKIWFERVSQKTRRDFILLMDEFSVISDWEMNKKIDRNFIQLLRNFIFNVSNVSFVLVFQTSYIYNLVDISTNFRDDLFDYFRGHHDEEIELKPFGPKETYKLITKPVSDNYQFSKSAINYAYQLCGGVPFIGALLGKTIWDYAQERNLRKINKNTLLEITRNIKNNQQWSFYIETLVNNLREKDTFLVLRKIAELEHETNTDQITEEMVRDKLNIKLERIREALDALKRTDLVETNHEFCKIRGTLLSTYLANIE